MLGGAVTGVVGAGAVVAGGLVLAGEVVGVVVDDGLVVGGEVEGGALVGVVLVVGPLSYVNALGISMMAPEFSMSCTS